MTELFDNLHVNYEDEICCAMRDVTGEHAFFINAKAKKIEGLVVRVRSYSSRLRLLDIG